MSPAQSLARLVQRIEQEIGVTASIGLSYGKGLAKLATDLDKPRGFSVIGRGEVLKGARPDAGQRHLGRRAGAGQEAGVRWHPHHRRSAGTGGALANLPVRRDWRYLHRFSHGQDDRRIQPDEETRSVSAETTFGRDLSDLNALATELRALRTRRAA